MKTGSRLGHHATIQVEARSQMVPIWLTRGANTSLRNQLVAQLLLGILSGSIKPGEHLPSVRSLARRLRIHPNTVNNAYRELAECGWLQTRPGHGVFATVRLPVPNTSLDAFARHCLRNAEALGFTHHQLLSSLQRISGELWTQPFLVIDPDPELACIIAAELREATKSQVESVDVANLSDKLTSNVMPIMSIRHASIIAPLLRGQPYQTIKIRSVPELLSGLAPQAPDSLIAIVSQSRVLLNWAETLLAALGVSSDSVIYRDPSERDWTSGLSACTLVAADIISAAKLPEHCHCFVLRLVSPSLAELCPSLPKSTGPRTGTAISVCS